MPALLSAFLFMCFLITAGAVALASPEMAPAPPEARWDISARTVSPAKRVDARLAYGDSVRLDLRHLRLPQQSLVLRVCRDGSLQVLEEYSSGVAAVLLSPGEHGEVRREWAGRLRVSRSVPAAVDVMFDL